MAIVVCPKCGVKNRISSVLDSKKTYRCGVCRARLSVVPKAGDNSVKADAVPRTTEIRRSQDAEIYKPATSHFLPARVSSWFRIRENQVIFSLVLLTLLFHLFVVPDAKVLVFDEHHYVTEARSIIHERALTTPEHPPLGKLFIAAGILAFGDNPWGWRIPSVIFAVGSLVLFYLICRRLAKKRVALIATFLLAFESLTFVMGNIGTLDVFSLTFMLLAFLLYLEDRYVLSGLSLALSVLCKMTGLLGIFVILGHWLLRRRRQSLLKVALFLFVAVAAFMVILPVLDLLATGHLDSPVARVSEMLTLSRNTTFENINPEFRNYVSYPWTWVLIPRADIFVDQSDFKQIINPIVWILIIPSIGYVLYKFIKRKTDISLFILLWFAATYLLWIPLVLLTNRITMLYYFYFTMGAVCMAIGLTITRLWDFATNRSSVLQRRLIKASVIGYMALEGLLFLVFTPILPEFLSIIQGSA